ncbi:MAG TPA: translation initiation factor IF-2 [Solirubrobacteraceae bacterium]|jgi:translation initiation factor IF-2|nr:translation initiation factor IF-2 [Solirubrobacteraceae bacterium]
MAKVRVHELAKAHDMSSKDVLDKLRAAGISVKAPASAVDVDQATAAIEGRPLPTNGAATEAVKAPEPPPPPTPIRRGPPPPPAISDRPPPAARPRTGGPGAPTAPAANARPTGARPTAAPSEPPAAAPGSDGAAAAAGEPAKQRPTRSSLSGERAPGAPGPGGRRRVVIDSQASRRTPGQQQQPPRRQRRGRRRRGTYDDTVAPLDATAATHTDLVRVNSGSTVKDIAESMGVPVPEIIKKLMMLGQMATLTQTLSDDAVGVLAEEFGKEVEIVHAADEVDTEPVYEDADADLTDRPPVITIMGHVDHGKTSLLDAIRSTEVVAGEAGGITQHIGAYQVHHNDKLVTFLDTPGHEAFTAMRARGARVTDIAVIVVAADDGVKPQTDEAIDHAKAADVPIVVAVNKIDKEGADPTRVRTEMTTRGLQPSEWGGEVEFVDVSAKSKVGLEDLLDTLLVVAELEELKANPTAPASGVVVESKLDPGRGPVVTILIQRGTLRVGDALVAGANWGRVRAMHDFTGKRVKEAHPGDPVEALGFDGVPEAGEYVRAVENDRRARQLAHEREQRLKQEQHARRSGRKRSLEDIFKDIQAGELKELNLLVKADVAGSAEALEDEIAKLPQDEVAVNIIRTGVGGINESDVMLAAASEAIIIGFNVRPVGDARAVAEREGVDIRNYSVIYKVLDELRAAMEGMLEPEEVEDSIGTVEIRQIFRASKIGIIAGSYVTDGKVTRGARTRLVRDGTIIYDGEIASLRRLSDDVREVQAGFECGIVLRNFQDVKEGDMLEVYETRKVDRALA